MYRSGRRARQCVLLTRRPKELESKDLLNNENKPTAGFRNYEGLRAEQRNKRFRVEASGTWLANSSQTSKLPVRVC
jgi:hypothetical protein